MEKIDLFPSVDTFTAATPPRIWKLGLSEVSSGGEYPNVDIFFVHGLKGHPEKTWTATAKSSAGRAAEPNSSDSLGSKIRKSKLYKKLRKKSNIDPKDDEQSCFWPRDLLAADLPDARIHTYGYDSSPSQFFNGPANKGNIHDHGRDLLTRVASVREQCRGRPVMFIAHSLGGLVVKSALAIASDEHKEKEHLRDISKSTIAVLFFGTPHRGSRWVDAGKIVSRFARLLGFSVSDLNLDLLTPNNPLLETLRDNFTKRLERDRLKVVSFQEQKGVVGINGLDELIVESDASAIDHRKENRLSINANHMEMCKFSDEGETYQTYKQLVLSEIKRYINDVGDEVDMSISALRSFQGHLDFRRHQIEKPYGETLSWLLLDEPKGPGLMNWLSSHMNGIYWIQGLPGSGKSTAMKVLAESAAVQTALKNAGWSHASMFLSDRIGKANRSWKGVLGAMLYHILRQERARLLPLLRSYIVPRLPPPTVVHDSNAPDEEEQFDWSFDRLKEVLLQCRSQTLTEFSWFFFIDALDEHDKSELSGSESIVGFLEQLISVEGPGLGKFKLCVASRPDNEFEVPMSGYPGFRMQNWTKSDITQVVYGQLMSHPDVHKFKQLVEYQKTLKTICETIVDNSHGLFIWVRLVVQDVWDGMTDGLLLTTLLGNLQRVPRERLPDFYLHILRKRPERTMRQTHAVLETVLRAQRPVSVLDIGILLETLSVKLEDLDPIKPPFSNQQLLRLTNSGVNLERNIKNLTGGLIQVVRENEQEQANMLHNFRTSSSAHVVHAPTWRIQFLHQTVKEFLQNQLYKSKIEAILLNWPEESVQYNFMDNGHTFHLKLATIAAGISFKAKAQSLWKLDPMETVIQHAPRAEKLTGRSLFHLLNSLDNLFSNTSRLGEAWALDYVDQEDETWILTFLAFAVSSDMKLFVSDALNNDKSGLSKPGRPLLHFAGWVPGSFPNPGMAEILLDAGANVHAEFDEKRFYDRSKTALESILYHGLDRDGQSHCDYIKLLISQGAKIDRRTGEEWTTVLHAIASMWVSWDKKMGIIRTIPLKCDLNSKNRHGETVFELLIQSAVDQNGAITEGDLKMLLKMRGARITRLLAVQICEGRLPSLIHNIFTRKAFLKPEYYKTKAQTVMSEGYPGWDRESRWRRLGRSIRNFKRNWKILEPEE